MWDICQGIAAQGCGVAQYNMCHHSSEPTHKPPGRLQPITASPILIQVLVFVYVPTFWPGFYLRVAPDSTDATTATAATQVMGRSQS